MENDVSIPIKPAARLASVQEYYFSRKLKEVARMNAEGRKVISLAIGSPDLPPSEQTVETLCEVAHQADAHGYQPTAGTPELRKAMAGFYKKWYGVELNWATEILPLIGSKEGILHITLAFVNPGEKVLVPNPGYPTYTSLSKLLGVEVVNYELREDDGWQPDFEQLESMSLEGVKLMWVNYPNMPTGGNARRETYEKLVAFAQKHQLVVVNDNPYSFILNEGEKLSILQVEGSKDCCIELNSLSKAFNMPGWRVGLCAANGTFTSWLLKVKSNIDSGTFRGIQLAAAKALTENTEAWHHTYNVEVYRKRRKTAERIMKALDCTFDEQQVGMFLWGRIPDRYATAEALTEKLLYEAGVFVTPGFIFGSRGERYLRISLCANERQMEEALERIEKVFGTP